VLIGQDASESKKYRFAPAEVKETSFRVDGVFLPDAEDGTLYFLELQFQQNPRFYSRLFAEIFVYLRRNESLRDWRAVVVFAHTEDDGGIPRQYSELAGRVTRIYLDQLTPEQVAQHPLDLLELLILPAKRELIAPKARAAAQRVFERYSALESVELQKLLIQILTQKLKNFSYEEAEMIVDLNLTPFEETRFYKDIIQRGEVLGEARGTVKGKQEIIHLTVERLLREGMSDDLILRVTEISGQDLADIKQRIAL
jgi:predicted transposase/invertase (TIGR01784 family)